MEKERGSEGRKGEGAELPPPSPSRAPRVAVWLVFWVVVGFFFLITIPFPLRLVQFVE